MWGCSLWSGQWIKNNKDLKIGILWALEQQLTANYDITLRTNPTWKCFNHFTGSHTKRPNLHWRYNCHVWTCSRSLAWRKHCNCSLIPEALWDMANTNRRERMPLFFFPPLCQFFCVWFIIEKISPRRRPSEPLKPSQPNMSPESSQSMQEQVNLFFTSMMRIYIFNCTVHIHLNWECLKWINFKETSLELHTNICGDPEIIQKKL